jgi:translocation and assembly module TamB
MSAGAAIGRTGAGRRTARSAGARSPISRSLRRTGASSCAGRPGPACTWKGPVERLASPQLDVEADAVWRDRAANGVVKLRLEGAVGRGQGDRRSRPQPLRQSQRRRDAAHARRDRAQSQRSLGARRAGARRAVQRAGGRLQDPGGVARLRRDGRRAALRGGPRTRRRRSHPRAGAGACEARLGAQCRGRRPRHQPCRSSAIWPSRAIRFCRTISACARTGSTPLRSSPPTWAKAAIPARSRGGSTIMRSTASGWSTSRPMPSSIAAPGGGWGIRGHVAAETRRLSNASVRDFLGGNAVASARVNLDPKGSSRSTTSGCARRNSASCAARGATIRRARS